MEGRLRQFTQRLLHRDAWLFVFYLHIFVLYLIAGSCMSRGESAVSGMEDVMKVDIKQDTVAGAVKPR